MYKSAKGAPYLYIMDPEIQTRPLDFKRGSVA